MAGGVAHRRDTHGGVRRAALVMGVVAAVLMLVTVGLLSELALADFVSIRNPAISFQRRVAIVWDSGDHLHYTVHLAAGRVLDLCPCTAQAAATQYWRASYHARSERQLELVTNQRPTTPAAQAADTVDLAVWGAGWSMGELARLSAPLLRT